MPGPRKSNASVEEDLRREWQRALHIDTNDMPFEEQVCEPLDDSHRQVHFFQELNELRTDGHLCDTVLIVHGRTIAAHRVALAAAIPYFRAMFTHDLLERANREVVLETPGVDADSVEALVNFVYTRELRVTNENVHALLRAADYFQMDWVLQRCADFLCRRMQLSNVLDLRCLLQDLGRCDAALVQIDAYVAKHFVLISETAAFLELTIQQLEALLSRDELYVDDEQRVFDAAIRWLQHDPQNRAKLTLRALSTVRLHLLRADYLDDAVFSHPLVQGDAKCLGMVCNVQQQRVLKTTVTRKVEKPRHCRDVPCIIYAIGAETTARRRARLTAIRPFLVVQNLNDDPHNNNNNNNNDILGGLQVAGKHLSTVEMFEPITCKWEQARSMATRRSRVGLVVLNREIYALGGYDGECRLDCVEIYNCDRNEWRHGPKLLHRRSAMGAAALQDRVYVCGGFNDSSGCLDSVECLQTSQPRVWKMVCPMQRRRSAAGVATLGGHIYIIGGHGSEGVPYNSVERYDPETDSWSYVAPMQTRRCRLGATAFNGKIWVCGGYDGNGGFLQSVEAYDPETDSWTTMAPMRIRRGRVSLVANHGRLYAIAGNDGFSNLSSVEIYNAKKNEWSLGTALAYHEGGVACAVVPFSPYKLIA